MNPRTLVVMDSREKLHVVDRPSQEELETLDLAEVQLVYNSSHFKSLATGGNVSQALVSHTHGLGSFIAGHILLIRAVIRTFKMIVTGTLSYTRQCDYQ